MTIKKAQTNKSITEVVTKPLSLADALVARKKELAILKNKPKTTHGGVRPNGGRPKGSLNKKTVDIKIARDMMQQAIASKTQELIVTEFRLAMGGGRLMKRWKELQGELKRGKNPRGNEVMRWRTERVTDEYDFEIYMSLEHDKNGRAKDKDEGVEYFYFEGSNPNLMALTNLLDRAFGRPKESLEIDAPVAEPLGEAGTGTTVVLRERFVQMVKETIITKGGQ